MTVDQWFALPIGSRIRWNAWGEISCGTIESRTDDKTIVVWDDIPRVARIDPADPGFMEFVDDSEQI